MKRFLAVLPLVIALVFTTACGDTVTGPTTDVVLPPFSMGTGAMQFEPSSNVWSVSLVFYSTSDRLPQIILRSSAPRIVTLEREQYLLSPSGDGRYIWTLIVSFKVVDVGESVISVEVADRPTQRSSFRVVGAWGNYGGKG